MPNHFHILAKEVIEGGISKFMSKLSTGYSMYFNRKYKRSGSLFEGRFKIIHANRDEYLKYLFVYIHLNPIKLIDPSWKEKGIKDMLKVEKYLASYKYSSYLDYNGVSRLENGLLDINSFPEYFCSKKNLMILIGIGYLINLNISRRNDLLEIGGLLADLSFCSGLDYLHLIVKHLRFQ